jgi:hypothetical protein
VQRYTYYVFGIFLGYGILFPSIKSLGNSREMDKIYRCGDTLSANIFGVIILFFSLLTLSTHVLAEEVQMDDPPTARMRLFAQNGINVRWFPNRACYTGGMFGPRG